MPLSDNRPLRIAFANISVSEWAAGGHYLKNLFSALRSLDDRCRPEIVLLVPPQAQPDSYNMLSPYVDQLLYMPTVPWADFWWRQIIRIQMRLGIYQSPLAPYLHEQRVDSIFVLNTEFGPRFSVPLLAWIPDFQHLHLPEMFSLESIQKRNKGFSRIANHADRVILSSQAALRDFERFAPQAAHKARVLPFVAQVPVDTYDSDPACVCDYYYLPQRFIYLPNQFWRHKNHEIVVQALTLIKAKDPEITVVCTGNTNDYRHPLYFAELLAHISVEGLRDNLIILGMVPHDHLFQLMRQSLAVLQASLFEGWSTTVEEAKSIGKRIILSDIPVHREQDPPRSVYFNPRDSRDLADKMEMIWKTTEPGPDLHLEASARAALPRRQQQFGRAFSQIAREAMALWKAS